MMNDAFYLSPDQRVAELASFYVPVYNYRLRYAGDVSYLESYLENTPIFNKTVKEDLKPIHCDDELYLFDILKVESKKDMEMRKIMISYWTNFAKYGNPSPFEPDNLTQW